MRNRRLYCFSLMMLSCISVMQAQWDAPFSHYWMVRGYYNPAFAGETEEIRTVALYRYQWAGMINAPQKVVMAADLPVEFLRRRHGTGIVAMTEQMGSLRNTQVGGQYSYRQAFGKGALQIGVQAGIRILQFDETSRRYTPGPGPYGRGTLQVNAVDKQLADLHGGIAWIGEHAFVGLSVMHITQPGFRAVNDSLLAYDLQTDSSRTSIPRSYHLMAGYNISLFSPLDIQPMVWIRSLQGEAHLQATIRMAYNQRFSGGFSWLSDDGFVFFGGIRFQGIEAGYAFHKHHSFPGRDSRGSHELYLRYDLPLDYFKPKLQPHKSIRLL